MTDKKMVKKKKPKSQEYFNPETGSDVDLWDDIDDDDEWAAIIREACNLDDLIGLTV